MSSRSRSVNLSSSVKRWTCGLKARMPWSSSSTSWSKTLSKSTTLVQLLLLYHSHGRSLLTPWFKDWLVHHLLTRAWWTFQWSTILTRVQRTFQQSSTEACLRKTSRKCSPASKTASGTCSTTRAATAKSSIAGLTTQVCLSCSLIARPSSKHTDWRVVPQSSWRNLTRQPTSLLAPTTKPPQ